MSNQIPKLEAVFGSIHLISETQTPTRELVADAIGKGSFTVCDFYVRGIELHVEMPWGYDAGNIRAIDHHAPSSTWERHVSSGNLACRFVESNPPAPLVVINHTDCDSVLSAGIASGILEPKQDYEEAVIAGDHTGVEHPIADLLQSVAHLRNMEVSLDCLRRYENGFEQESLVQALLQEQADSRHRAAELSKNAVTWFGTFAHVQAAVRVESEYFIPLLPDAWLIAVTFPSQVHPGRTAMKLRMGLSAPAGMSLQRLALHEVDPAYAGRWNAGSNQRGGGSTQSPADLATGVAARLARYVESLETR